MILQGRAPNGMFWAKIAEPYPTGLCNELAQCLELIAPDIRTDLAG